MDVKNLLHEAANNFLDDDINPDHIFKDMDIDDAISSILRDSTLPAYLKRQQIADMLDDPEVPAYIRKKYSEFLKRNDEPPIPEMDVDDIEIPTFKRIPQTNKPQKEIPRLYKEPMENVPEDEEVPKFLRDRGVKAFPDDIERPAFARKRSEEIAKELGVELKRPR